MAANRTYRHLSLRIRAILLSLLLIYTCVVVPVLAASPTPGDPSVAAGGKRKARGARQPSPLVPPPPAAAPSLDLLVPIAPSTERSTGKPSRVEPAIAKELSDTDGQYVLGPGDTLTVTDFSSQEAGMGAPTITAPILPDGTVTVHPIGVLKAAGLSLGELAAVVNKRAEEFIIKPDIEVVVSKIRPSMVYILGEIQKPGLYTTEIGPISGSENVVSTNANLTVVSAIQKAGGIKPTADVRNIRVTRLGGNKQYLVNLWQLIVEGDTSQDIPIMSGDVVFVPKGGADFDADALGLTANLHRRVRIWGAVKNPGLIDMDPGDDIVSLISKAGGFTGTATKSWILLSRLNRDGSISTRKIPFGKALHDPDALIRSHVEPGDLVLVHDSLIKKGAFTVYNGLVYTVFAALLVTYAGAYNQWIQPKNSTSTSTTTGTVTAIPAITPPATSR